MLREKNSREERKSVMGKSIADIFRALFSILSLFVYFSCSEPSIRENFIKQSGKNADGSYRFNIDLSDSLRSNTLYIYALIDASEPEFDKMPSFIPLRIEALAPSGSKYCEEVGIPTDSFVKSTRYSRQYESLYRSGFNPVQYGEWILSVTVIDEDKFKGFRGIGLKHVKEIMSNGKR